jgi:hypothetical protein
MKDWIKPMLKNDAIQFLDNLVNESGIKEEDRKELLESRLDEIEHADEGEIFYELTDYFQMDFGRELRGSTQLMTTAFGSVLSDLPEEAFKKLSDMKDVFFIFNELGWTTIKKLNFDEPMEEIQMVFFDNVSSSMPFEALRGMIARAFAHVYLGHMFGTGEVENETDKLAIRWGFETEIKVLMDYFAELGKPTRTET